MLTQHPRLLLGTLIAFALLTHPVKIAQSQLVRVLPEQRQLCVRSPEMISPVPIPDVGVPFTVSDQSDSRVAQRMSLDEAIQIAIRNADVIRAKHR